MKYVFILFSLFILSVSCGKGVVDNDGIDGFWEGPHPELAHVKFVFHIENSVDNKLTGKGFWVENGLYHADFPIDSVNYIRNNIEIKLGSWGCIYKGKLSANGNYINGVFSCQGEQDDSVRLKKIAKNSLHGLFPEHLDENGEFTYQYSKPIDEKEGLKTDDLSGSGLSSPIIDEIVKKVATGQYGRIHSLLILKDNKLVCEEYFYGFDRNVLHPMESTTKSVTSLLTGIAVDKGRIKSVNENVWNFFPEFASLKNGKKTRLTIKNLLTMTSGMMFDERAMLYNPNRISFLLGSKAEYTPGEKFNYSAGNTELTGAIIKKSTGKFADEYAKEYLFDPLGITDFRWDTFKQNGYPLCGGSLWLRPRDMAKIGLLVINKGEWNGKQLIPKRWIEESTSGIVITGIGDDKYGFQWWVSDLKSGNKPYHLIWANGLGSQFIFIFPDLDLVITTTGGNWAGGNNGRSWDIFAMLKEYLSRLEAQGNGI